MKAGPDIAMIAALVGDPARANMLTALMTGRALTASELAHQAGITPQTASSHLSKLEAGGLIEQEKQGRHRYYRLSDPDVAGVLEGLAGLAARAGHMRVRTGPKDPALRRARICYDHLAGDLGVQMLDSLRKQRLLRQSKQAIELTPEGERFMAKALQIDAGALAHPRRPLCKACLDWSERRHHLAGTLGAAIMNRFTELNWAARDAAPGSRVVNFTRSGEKRFAALFGESPDKAPADFRCFVERRGRSAQTKRYLPCPDIPMNRLILPGCASQRRSRCRPGAEAAQIRRLSGQGLHRQSGEAAPGCAPDLRDRRELFEGRPRRKDQRRRPLSSLVKMPCGSACAAPALLDHGSGRIASNSSRCPAGAKSPTISIPSPAAPTAASSSSAARATRPASSEIIIT